MDRDNSENRMLRAPGASFISSPTSSAFNYQNTLKCILLGGLTGGIEICITFPTEYVKTQLQLDQNSGLARKYTGPMNCASLTVKEYGAGGLYRGLSVLLYGSIPKSAVRFGTFEELKRLNKDERGNLSMTRSFLCGLGAGVCEAVLAVTPMETVKVKFINDQTSANPRYRGFSHGVSCMIKEQGFRGVYQGVVPTILKQGSNQAMRFFVVENLKKWYNDGDSSKKTPMLITGVFGGIAGAISVYGNTPIDVIKTRLQGLDAHKYKGTVDCAMQIYKNEGLRGFYKGTVPRLSRVVLDVGVTFMVYDTLKEIFDRIWVTS